MSPSTREHLQYTWAETEWTALAERNYRTHTERCHEVGCAGEGQEGKGMQRIEVAFGLD